MRRFRLFFLAGVLLILFPVTVMADNILLEYETLMNDLKVRAKMLEKESDWREKMVEEYLKTRLKRDKELIERKYNRLIDPLKEQEVKQRKEYIATLKLFIARYPNAKVTPAAMLRLAELYYEYDGDLYLQAMKRYEKLLELYDAGVIVQKPLLPKKDFSRSIELYKQVVTRFPHHRLLDVAYYLIGYCYEEMGEPQKALVAFQKLIELRPDSVFVPEAYFRIGEYYFDPPGDVPPDIPKAIYNYKQVLKYRNETNLYDKALYKLGWSYYRLNQYPLSVTYFVKVVDYYEKRKKEGILKKKGASDVYKESLDYIAINFSEWTGLQGLIDYFKKIGDRPYEIYVFKKLGDVYFQRTEYDKALKVYYYVLKRWPMDISALEVQKKIMQCYERKNDIEHAVEAREKLVTLYGPGSEWYEKNKDNPALEKISKEMTEKILIEYATFHHARAQEKNDLREYQLAIEGYKKFLKLFPFSPRTAEVEFYIAEIYYSLGKYEEAAKYYLLVTQNVVTRENKYLSDAAYSLVMCYNQILSQEKKFIIEEAKRKYRELKQRVTPPPVTYSTGNTAPSSVSATTINKSLKSFSLPVSAPIYVTATGERLFFTLPASPPTKDDEWLAYVSFPRSADRLIKTCNYFLKLLPTHKKAPKIIYIAGQTYFTFGRYDDARNELMKVVEYYPRNPLAREAVKTIVYSYVKQKRYDLLAKWAKEIEKREEFSDPEMKKFFAEIVGGAIFKEAREKEKSAKNYIEVAKKYLEIVKKYPRSPIAYKALFNAAKDYEKGGDLNTAIAIYRRLIKEYPGNELLPAAYYQIAYDYDTMLDFDRAINAYLTMAKKFPKDPLAKDALNNAAWALYRLERWEEAANVFKMYATRYPQDPSIREILWRIGECYEKAGKWDEALKSYRFYLKKYPDDYEKEMLVYYKIATHFKEIGDTKNMEKYYKLILKKFAELSKKAGKPVGNAYAAEASFYFAMKTFKVYQSIKLKLPQKVMARLLVKKKKMMPVVLKAFKKVIEYKDPNWSVAALYMMGRTFTEFADTLFNAPIPANLTEEEKEVYREELENLAYPLEDQASAFYEKCVALAEEKNIDNKWVREARKAVHEFKPEVPVYVLKVKPEPAFGKLFPIFGFRKVALKKKKRAAPAIVSFGGIKIDPLNIREYRKWQAIDRTRKTITYSSTMEKFIMNDPFLRELRKTRVEQ